MIRGIWRHICSVILDSAKVNNALVCSKIIGVYKEFYKDFVERPMKFSSIPIFNDDCPTVFFTVHRKMVNAKLACIPN